MDSLHPWTSLDSGSVVIATAIHAGHDLRPDVRELTSLTDEERSREEDIGTDRLTTVAPTRIVVHRSRFEVDLNRPRDEAIYLLPEHAWGLGLWKTPPTDRITTASLATYDRFYRMLEEMLQKRINRGKRFLVLDIHSYNHRRGGPDAPPEPSADNPDLNIGTGSLDHDRWGWVVEHFASGFSKAAPDLAVAENVRFRGGHMSRWIHARFGEHGCCLALEFKKTYMDEWTGEIFDERLSKLHRALSSAARDVDAHLEAA